MVKKIVLGVDEESLNAGVLVMGIVSFISLMLVYCFGWYAYPHLLHAGYIVIIVMFGLFGLLVFSCKMVRIGVFECKPIVSDSDEDLK